MSRCFPFPPPGYEKKTRPENHDLLKKEKHKEKKHKKERRDREKKEGREKRDKDRSNEKHREKRDKKEKHRDKKKDREKNRDKEKDNRVFSDERKILGQGEAYEGDKSAVLGEKKNSKLLHEMGGKVTIQEEKRRNMEIRKDGGTPKVGVTSPPTPLASSERSKERKHIDEKKHRHGPEESQRSSAQKFSGFKAVGISTPMEKNAGWKTNVNEKILVKELDDKRGERRDDESKEKSNREKLVEHSRAKDSNKVHPSELKEKDFNKNSPLKAQGSRIADVPENLRKRKEFGPNGVSYEDDNGPYKTARIASLSHPTAQNGRTLHSSQRSNGIQSASRICQASSMADQNPKKPPHPDMKYLAQILSVPKIEDWSEIDDQDWLFYTRNNKPKTEISGADSRQVWAEALRIEPADLFALPYVIPR